MRCDMWQHTEEWGMKKALSVSHLPCIPVYVSPVFITAAPGPRPLYTASPQLRPHSWCWVTRLAWPGGGHAAAGLSHWPLPGPGPMLLSSASISRLPKFAETRNIWTKHVWLCTVSKPQKSLKVCCIAVQTLANLISTFVQIITRVLKEFCPGWKEN